MRRSVVMVFVASLSAVAVLAAPRPARAGWFLGAELDGGSQVSNKYTRGGGFGFVGQLGYRVKLGPVYLQPEAEGSYLVFPGISTTVPLTRVLGGARFGLSGKIQPALYAHAGIGWLGQGRNGREFDGGFSLGLKLIPFLRFGAQVGYNVLQVPDDIAGQQTNFKFVSYGVHAAVEF